MEGLTFSFTLKSETKVNQYAGKRGIIVHAAPETVGGSNKISLTADLLTASGLQLTGTELITFGYDSDENPIIAFTTEKSSTSARLAKNGIASSKRLHKVLTGLFELDTTKDNLLEVSALNNINGINYVTINSSENEEVVLDQIEAVIEAAPQTNAEDSFVIPEVTL